MTNVQTNSPVFAAAMGAASLDLRNEGARLKLFVKLDSADVTVASISRGGADLAEFQSGYLTEWQGAAFAATFDTAASKVEIKGKVLDRLTGSRVAASKTKEAWSRDLSSKVAGFRSAYGEWLGMASGDVAGEGEAATGAAKSTGAVDAGQGAAREINIRITEDMGKLFKAVTKDREVEAPKLKADHKEMLAAFQRCLDLVK
jgi:hypothetical protein